MNLLILFGIGIAFVGGYYPDIKADGLSQLHQIWQKEAVVMVAWGGQFRGIRPTHDTFAVKPPALYKQINKVHHQVNQPAETQVLAKLAVVNAELAIKRQPHKSAVGFLL